MSLDAVRRTAMRRFILGLAAAIAATAGLALAADSGPKADVAALRALQLHLTPGLKIDQVHVVGNYAMLGTYDQYSTSNPVYERISGEHWKKILPGGETSMGVGAMTAAGVPASVARKLCSAWTTAQLPHNTPCMDYRP
jgi:hypothetical protein